ncbi:Lytic transglycosylase [Sphingobium yanoikuyae]|uniref:Lytic transglycosylase n=1 Tax=Sphingobium yanoikuyae TaxID=13690 RepID=A0A084ENA3_SPHYA|nr:lytic transglycosylase domain-containing protein [Sphingobium yanoikuyae]KEZ19445.1 Lytic transglycosylase [Sphingobium yanoikuyae]
MHARPPSRCHRRAIRLAAASVIVGSTSFLFPVIALLAPGAAAAQVTSVAAHPYAPHVAEAAQRFGIPEAWIWAVMRVESNGDAGATSPVGAMGLMQIMPATWATLTARYGLGANVWDVRANILGGAAYLREMVDRYGDLPSALAAYNAGPGRVDDWRARGRSLPAETIAYVAKIAPMVGTSGIAAPAGLPAGSRMPIASTAPSWRSATLFVLRGDGEPDSDNAASGTAPPAPTERLVSAPSASPAMRSSRTSIPAPHGLFAPVSGSSEQ